jgi:hypothetical protein
MEEEKKAGGKSQSKSQKTECSEAEAKRSEGSEAEVKR